MSNIFALTEFHDKLPANIVRYYNNGNGSYLIYTLNEKDANGYVKLYVAKVIENNGKYNIETIIDENEWNTVKDNIKQIINENRTNGKVSFTDLDSSVLSNTVITESKAFKLLEDLVKVLGENINVVAKAPEATPAPEIAPTPEVAPIPTSDDATAINAAPEIAPAPTYPEAVAPATSIYPESPAVGPAPINTAPAPTYPEAVAPAASIYPESPVVGPAPINTAPEMAPAPTYPEAVAQTPTSDIAPAASTYPESPVVGPAPINTAPETTSVDYKQKYEEATQEIETLKAKLSNITNILNN